MADSEICTHNNVSLVNPYELIRKYFCKDCEEVMMCECDRDFGERFLPHQLNTGTDLDTQKSIPVTLGFQRRVCRECKGLPLKAYPKAAMPGLTSKIKRYYWREIFVETTKRLQAIKNARGDASSVFGDIENEEWKQIERDVVDELKKQHSEAPKYIYSEEPKVEILEKYNVEIINLKATYVRHSTRKAGVLYDNTVLAVEDFAAEYFKSEGYRVLHTESRPFHVIFAVFLHGLIQDVEDGDIRLVSFGDRFSFEAGSKELVQIWTYLPSDFGTKGYLLRRNAVKLRVVPSRKIRSSILPIAHR